MPHHFPLPESRQGEGYDPNEQMKVLHLLESLDILLFAHAGSRVHLNICYSFFFMSDKVDFNYVSVNHHQLPPKFLPFKNYL